MARFILSKSKVLEQYNSLKGFGIISYSFKTNPIVGKILEDSTDCMFSVHFINELKLINDRRRVWFLAQALDKEILERLFAMGVSKFVIENMEDLDALISYITQHNKEIELLLRMKLKEHTIKTEKYYVFGIESDVVNQKVLELKSNRLIKKLGIHIHRKTQNVSEWDLKRELSEIILPEVLETIDYLDIGGGIPVLYKNITDRIIPTVLEKLDEAKQWLSSARVHMIIEPGRYISGPAIRLETKIVGMHGSTIVVDASVYNASPDTLIVPIKLMIEGESEQGKPYVVKGITPCSTDIFRYRAYFPESRKLKKGDKMIFLNAGAYNFHTEFCELDKVATEVVD
ncbi:MAG: decarboxylase [archaeon]